jgi:hypothetical protein
MTDEPQHTDESSESGDNEKKAIGVEPDAAPLEEFMGRGRKKKKPGKQPPVKTQVEEQIEAALAASSQQAKRKIRRKKKFRQAMAGVGVILIAFIIYYGLKPFEGSRAFGVCRLFLEGSVTYPQHLRLSTVETFETFVRIWYTQVDSFGEYRLEPIQCYFKKDPERGTILEKVLINRREVPASKVENFNRAMPAIVRLEMDLVLPKRLPDNLQELQTSPGSFRKPVI